MFIVQYTQNIAASTYFLTKNRPHIFKIGDE